MNEGKEKALSINSLGGQDKGNQRAYTAVSFPHINRLSEFLEENTKRGMIMVRNSENLHAELRKEVVGYVEMVLSWPQDLREQEVAALKVFTKEHVRTSGGLLLAGEIQAAILSGNTQSLFRHLGINKNNEIKK